MWTERWVSWLRSPRALGVTVLASIVAVGAYASGGAPTDSVMAFQFEDGMVALYGNCPWRPDPRDEAALRLASRVCGVMGWVSPFTTVLALVLAVGGVWARAVRPARVPLALTLLPVMNLLLHLGEWGLSHALAEGSAGRPWLHDVFMYVALGREQLARVIEAVLWAGGLLMLWRWAGVRLGRLAR